GSLSAFIHFLADSALLKQFMLISTDRAGFGYSNFGFAEPSINKQAELLMPVIERYKNNRPIVLVGHSLAAPVIAQMAVNHPDLIDGLVIVAGSIDPNLEPNEAWFRVPLSTPFLNWILPRSVRASNEELYNFKSELERMLPLWGEIKMPVVVIQGGKDILVDHRNADFAKKMIVNAPVEIIYKEDMNHFVPWSNPELIIEGIERVEGLIVNHHSK
ncbi:MAG TPA: alpha/beta hydrolase, partial [Cyclobacteriaceae bacterium]|nr:alpha/beta hydrolase [Cyclobacteriaceae bacterium]